MSDLLKINSLVGLFTVFLFTPPYINASSPTDVVGRNLDVRGAGWAGHVGIVTDNKVTDSGNYVVEALWEPVVLQINALSNFKTRSPYWGAKYGINSNNTSGTKIINEGAFQTSLKCAEYTITIGYKPGTGQWGVPFSCPKFRCDTFVSYLYWWGGYTLPTYSPPGNPTNDTIPLLVFRAIPYYRSNFIPEQKNQKTAKKISIPLKDSISINTATVEELELLSIEEFHQSVDLPPKELTKNGINNILKYSGNLNLSYEKRLFLLDKLGFIVTPDMLPMLIKLYYKNTTDDVMSRMIIRDTQDLYQQNKLLSTYPKEKKMLLSFYNDLLNSELSNQISPIVIRGYIALNQPLVVLANHNKIDTHLSNVELDKSIKMSLHIALFLKSTELEQLYINDIMYSLNNEENAELDTLFYGAVAAQLGKYGLDLITHESKSLMSTHLNTVLSKLNSKSINKSFNGNIYPQSQGIALEAFALINATSLKEASRYIADYLSQLSPTDQEQYVLGFSNNLYLQRAFNEEPFLIQFKNHHKQLYKDTVGLSMR